MLQAREPLIHPNLRPTHQVVPRLERTAQLPNLNSDTTEEVHEGSQEIPTSSPLVEVQSAVLNFDRRPRRSRNNRLPARSSAALSQSVMERLLAELAELVDDFIATFPATRVPVLQSPLTDAQPHRFAYKTFVVPSALPPPPPPQLYLLLLCDLYFVLLYDPLYIDVSSRQPFVYGDV